MTVADDLAILGLNMNLINFHLVDSLEEMAAWLELPCSFIRLKTIQTLSLPIKIF